MRGFACFSIRKNLLVEIVNNISRVGVVEKDLVGMDLMKEDVDTTQSCGHGPVCDEKSVAWHAQQNQRAGAIPETARYIARDSGSSGTPVRLVKLKSGSLNHH